MRTPIIPTACLLLVLAGRALPAPTATPTTPAASRAIGGPGPSPTASKPPPGFTDTDTPAQVGTDIPAGTYRVDQPVTNKNCYWQKSKDAEGADIIDNDIPQGGRPQVSLKKGTWFTSERCGRWQPVK